MGNAVNKKKIRSIISIVLLIILTFYGGTKVGAAQNTPGSVYDPLITQSYLEQRLKELEIERTGFQKVTLAKNKILSLEAGSQIIVLTGTASAYGKKGLVDITEGIALEKELSVMKYHLCLAPETGSGLQVTTSCTVYVTGNYTIY